jgi:hypothetical protein
MLRLITHAISASLIGMGATAWAFAGRGLVADPDLRVPLNPLGINGSPYGEVFAMAMQGPIDTYYNGVLNSGPLRHTDVQKAESAEASQVKTPTSLTGRFKNLLASLDKVAETRTNPKAASKSLRFYLRRQIEDKLRFAYQLDPAHYANYNSLHFFLTEPQLGTRPELTPSASKLAEDTIRYCLKQDQDPRPALTAAAAVTNVLELMFNDYRAGSRKFTTTQMHQQLDLLDVCLARYVTISHQWDLTKNWDLLSPMRIAECEDRVSFIRKIREAAVKTIDRLEGRPQESQATN